MHLHVYLRYIKLCFENEKCAAKSNLVGRIKNENTDGFAEQNAKHPYMYTELTVYPALSNASLLWSPFLESLHIPVVTQHALKVETQAAVANPKWPSRIRPQEISASRIRAPDIAFPCV